jgi:hypothetical protein
MNPLPIGLIVFAFVFGGALFGMYLGRILPPEHLSSDAKNVIVVSMTMVATLAAMVLGLLIASAQSSLDEKDGELRKAGGLLVLLDRTMAEYGPETAEARKLLKQTMVARIELIWPEEKAATVAAEAIGRGAGAEVVQEKLCSFAEGRCAAMASIHGATDHARHAGGTMADSRADRRRYPMAVSGRLGVLARPNLRGLRPRRAAQRQRHPGVPRDRVVRGRLDLCDTRDGAAVSWTDQDLQRPAPHGFG